MAFKVGDTVRRINGSNGKFGFQNMEIDVITEVRSNFFGDTFIRNGYIVSKYPTNINDEQNLELVKEIVNNTPLIKTEITTTRKIVNGIHHLTIGSVQTYNTINGDYVSVYDVKITKASLTQLIELFTALKEAAQS